MSNGIDPATNQAARIVLLEAQLAEAHAAVRSRDLLIETLRVQLARMKRMAFGPSSEKLGVQIAQLELALEELEAEAEATFATLAHVVVSKFDHHLPLYRQAEMMAAQGLPLYRSTLAGWTGQAAALLDPVVARIRALGLEAGKLHTDDTPVPMLDPGRGRTATGRLWVCAADDRACGGTSPPLSSGIASPPIAAASTRRRNSPRSRGSCGLTPMRVTPSSTSVAT